MSETRKARERRLEDGFFQYCEGDGIDIGCGRDPLFKDIFKWDIMNSCGDATFMQDISDDEFDFVYSSHCLEHLSNPITALNNWFRILKTNGYLILYIPHRDLYEKKKELPSRWNLDHKNFFLPYEDEEPNTLGLLSCLNKTDYKFEVIYIKTCDFNHTITNPLLHSNGEYSIECIVKKL